MSDIPCKPVVFLAFANEQRHGQRICATYLKNRAACANLGKGARSRSV